MLVRLCRLSLVLATACAGTSPTPVENNSTKAEPGSEPSPAADAEDAVELAVLEFANPGEEHRFKQAHACLAERGSSWEHEPLAKHGNFISESWCRGERAKTGCSGGNFREQRGVDWASIATLHYPQDWPEVFGLEINVGHNPTDEGWNLMVYGATNGKTILGAVGDITFTHHGTKKGAITIGTRYTYEIEESAFSVNLDDDAWQVLDRVRASPKALREEGIRHHEALEAKVVSALQKNEVRKCVYGPPPREGLPPECDKQVPLTAKETKAELAKVRAEMATIRKTLEKPEKLHAALLEIAPTDCF